MQDEWKEGTTYDVISVANSTRVVIAKVLGITTETTTNHVGAEIRYYLIKVVRVDS